MADNEIEDVSKKASKKKPKGIVTYEQLAKDRRQYLVFKRSDMIQKSRRTLSLMEGKIVDTVISMIKPGDKITDTFVFDCELFYSILGYKKESYSELRAMLYDIQGHPFGIVDEYGTEKIVHWFTTINLIKEGNVVKADTTNIPARYVAFTIHPELAPYLFDLDEQYRVNKSYYTSYQLQNIIYFKHQYSQPLYELLKSYAVNRTTWTFELGTGTENDLQIKIAMYEQQTEKSDADRSKGGRMARKKVTEKFVPLIPKSWQHYAMFDRDVLSKSIEEINRLTDLNVSYTPSKILYGKKYRRYVAVIFNFSQKSKTEIDKRNQMIDSAYTHQMTLDELIDDSEKEETVEVVFDDKKEKEKERVVDAAGYKIAASMFYDDFTQTQIKHLVETAFEKITAGKIKFDLREMWACDYIDHYNKQIKATSEDTRTTPYKRLLDMLKKDYDDFADQITAYNDPDYVEPDIDENTDISEIEQEIQRLQKLKARKMKEQ